MQPYGTQILSINLITENFMMEFLIVQCPHLMI